ncbi:hypothetical protein M5D96_007814 [Drosophila gunungcola]|uniref:Uncharacterized protein n=1 Tax=Drosophila gunungcola TaxID=103775 RepID=A0A9P9YLC4_9MUSC|nr:hypothetical protein M5D96_007814 [Drosophila gunungcola]
MEKLSTQIIIIDSPPMQFFIPRRSIHHILLHSDE